jgi:transmembrane sensor
MRPSPMANVAEDLTEAREHVVPKWTDARERAVHAALGVRIVQRRRRQVTLLAAALFLVFAGGIAALRVGNRHAPLAQGTPTQNASERVLFTLSDGSTVTEVAPGAEAEPIEVSPSSVAVRLSSGTARFSVTPNPARAFHVTARDVTVTVLGTIFTVGIEPGGVRVAVERGLVHVAWPAGDRDLRVGEQALFSDPIEPAKAAAKSAESPVAPSEPETAAEASEAEPALSAAPGAPAERAPKNNTPPVFRSSSWRDLAQDGEYGRAYARLIQDGPGTVNDEPGDLLLAADVARLGGHPEAAVQNLNRVVTAHASDSRAPLAAFTLGRTLLDQLGRPREAALAFASARKLDPHGALAQDALAREVESWSRAGETGTAHDRAVEYVAQYPKGRRLSAVKRLGGIE